MTGSEFREQLTEASDRIIVAYDGMEWDQIMATAEEVGPYTGLGKTNSAHVRPGADFAVDQLGSTGQFTMLDSKFHDIPRTVELSVREATLAGASLVTVHAGGGQAMLEAAVKGAEEGRNDQRDAFKRQASGRLGGVLGITVLTSLDAEDCFSIFGIPKEDEDGIKKKVVEFTHMALDAGLTGIVCSPLETEAIRANSNFDSLLVVNPGITPDHAKKEGDQKRTTNATQAIEAGADFVVVGGGINKAADYGITKAEAAQKISAEVEKGLTNRLHRG
ncbi:orotidine-5'-phosphate decarboxylase [Candidatus Saccharibacteria bacterium]|nr:orotidine-5'-phosphate decarboxylase [Candidatus Saccharibacteria bacterium]